MKKEIVILGAGLVGSLLSLYLARQGYTVKVFERRSDLRKAKLYAGRSINLAMSDRGLNALHAIGLENAIRAIAIPMLGRMMHDTNGNLNYQAYGLDDSQYINSVSRSELNLTLIHEADKHPNISFFFDQRCERVDLKNKSVHFINDKTLTNSTIAYDLIFGADGAFSALRLSMMLQSDKMNYSQSYLEHGYKELTIPAGVKGSIQIEKHALHIWPRKQFMLIALPNLDGSFTCTLFFPFKGKESFESIQTEAEILAFFKAQFPDTLALMPNLVADFMHNPASSLVTVKCDPWTVGNHAALIGDAAHAIVPFYGQGMNCGFEDCFVLDSLITKYDHDWDQILAAYEQLRKPDGDAIADLAKANFIEMRDKVADPQFLLRKKIEAKITKTFPQHWLPLYNMVTFSNIRYSEALRRGQVQDEIMDQIMQLSNADTLVDNVKFEHIVFPYIKHLSI